MTELNVEKARELLEKATPELALTVETDGDCTDDGRCWDFPWKLKTSNGVELIIEGDLSDEDAALIAAAPDLARLVLRQAAEIERMRGALEWAHSAMEAAQTHLDSARNVRAVDELRAGCEIARAALAAEAEA